MLMHSVESSFKLVGWSSVSSCVFVCYNDYVLDFTSIMKAYNFCHYLLLALTNISTYGTNRLSDIWF